MSHHALKKRLAAALRALLPAGLLVLAAGVQPHCWQAPAPAAAIMLLAGCDLLLSVDAALAAVPLAVRRRQG